MKHFALDLWDDLCDKRLWPVAAALLVAVIAIPLFVMKPSKEPSPAGATGPAARQASPTTPAVRVEEGTGGSSRLGVFDDKDPFRPPARVLKPSKSSDAGTAGAATAGPSPGPGAASAPSTGSAPATSTGGSGSVGGGSGTVGGAPRTVVRTKGYTYVIDVDFGEEGKVRRRRGVSRLSILPSSRDPLVVFLGVTASARRAVFMLNPALEQRGQGTCRPSRTTCNFLYLATEPEKNGHYVVDDDGVTHVLRLKAIRRVSLSQAKKSSRARARGSARARTRSFTPPVLLDERR